MRAQDCRKDAITVLFVLTTLGIAFKVEDVGFIAELSGALVSGSIIWIFPPIMHMRTLSIQAQMGDGQDGGDMKGQRARQWWCSCVISVMGVSLVILGLANVFGLLDAS